MTIKGKLQDWAKRLAGARTALGELHDLDTELRAQHSVAVRERERLASASPPVEEIVANMEHVIDERTAEEAESMAYGLRHAFGGGFEMRRDGNLAERKPTLPDWFYRADFTLARLAGFAPGLVKARLAEILRAALYEAGSPMADRRRFLAEADAKIAEIERAHEQLVDEAAALEPPVTLTLLPEVKARRDAAAAKADRERVQRAERERIEAQVNAEVRPRAVPSLYLRANVPGRSDQR
jgi:hypothetical protein